MKIPAKFYSLSFALLWSCLVANNVLAANQNVTLHSPQSLHPFSLKGQYGKQFTLDQLKGRWSIVFFGFTSCPDVCPVTQGNLEVVRAEMGFRMRPDHIPIIVFLAVDPAHDKEGLEEYLAFFHPQYICITGEVNEFCRLNIKSPDDSNYTVVHTSRVSIIDPQGRVVAKILLPFDPHKTGGDLMQLINRQARATSSSAHHYLDQQNIVSTKSSNQVGNGS